jgi:hypothetical protein
MIPLNTLSRSNVESGVRFRVAACRKRIRNSRTTHRATNNIQLHMQRQEITISAAALSEKSTEGILAGSVGCDLTAAKRMAPGPVPGENGDREEVGIT